MMQRRKFLETFSLFTIGAGLAPSLLSSCRNRKLFEDVKFQGKVVIIGAGVSGMYAGYLLKSKGAQVTILEASDTHGGRIGRNTSFADYHLDTGAQWVKGRNTLVFDLIMKNNIRITPEDIFNVDYWFENRVVDTPPRDVYVFSEKNLPDISYREYAAQKGFDFMYDDIIESLASEEGASASKLSAYWNWKEKENLASGTNVYKLEQSYFELIDNTVAQPVKNNILYNHAVNSIDYTSNEIKVYTTNGNVFSCDKLIITVPVSILKSNQIQFSPSLPSEKVQSFNKIGMDPGMKVFLKFQRNFYRKFLYGGKTCAMYIDDTTGKITNQNVLLAMPVGDKAQNLSNLGSDAAIINAIIQELDTIYAGQASANFMSGLVCNYADKPFIQGMYSYSTVQMGDARQTAAKNIQNRIFFAGEAMNTNGHHGTVHGAMESSYQSVIQLFQSVKA